MVKIFDKKYLTHELDLPWAAEEDHVVGNSRWTVNHEIIFIDPADGKHYRTHYSVGATECQEEGPWEYDDKVSCEEVEKKEVTVVKWVAVE